MKQKKESFSKRERLCGIKAVRELFAGGRTINMPPLRVVYRVISSDESLPPLRVLISVPKRNFKKAVDRNLIRRRIKEAWRKNKQPLMMMPEKGKRLELALLWIDTEIRTYDDIEKCVIEVMGRLSHLKY
ncbi:MAG: ribonuclease P protein component [Bacteroidales bacterium]|jgi:ribonuclease P protein component|nr:ribonuclease P protein component [Bacteroidales bacterium]